MKNKISITLILLLIFLVGCQQESKNEAEADLTSGPTPTEELAKGTTKADQQFGKLRQKKSDPSTSSKSEKKIIRTVRPELARFVEEQFASDKIKEYKLDDFVYYVNNKSMGTLFNGNAQHSFKKTAYDYQINIKRLDKEYAVDDFIEKLWSEDQTLKSVDLNGYGRVLVKNIGDNSYSAELYSILTKNSKSYQIQFKSEYMSIAEIIMLAEKYVSLIK